MNAITKPWAPLLTTILFATACGDDGSGTGSGGSTGVGDVTSAGPAGPGSGPTSGQGGDPSGSQGSSEGSGASDGNGGAGGSCVEDCSGSGGSGGHGEGGFIDVDPPTCVDTSTLPSWRQGMAIFEWKRLASADLAAVTPDVQPGGYYSARIDAWNGFAADTTNNVMYLAAVGGHGDYAGNEVYSIDLTADAPQWVRESDPTPQEDYLIDEPYYADGRPSPTHTYYTSWFIEQRGKVFRFAGAATWGTGNGGTPHIDSWDPDTKDWDPAGSHPDLGPAPIYEAATTKNVLTGDVYQLQADNHVYAWYAASDTTADLGNAEGGTGSFYDMYKSASAVDPVAQKVFFFVDDANPGSARVYDIAAGTWSSQALTGPGAAEVTADDGQAMAYYDVCAQRFVVKTLEVGAVYFVDPVTFEATPADVTGELPPNMISEEQSANGVHTLFQYLPALGGYAYQPTYGAGLYFIATQ